MKNLLIYLLGLLLYAACSPVIYTPTAHHVPLFEEKGELAITAAYHSIEEGDGEGVNLQLATAVGNSLAVTATINYFKDVYRNEVSKDYWKSRGILMEAGVGKFGFIGNSDVFKYELYGGMGYGRSNNSKSSDRISAAIFKPYIQPNIGISGKHIEFAVSTRLAMVSFINPNYHTLNAEYREQIRNFFDEKNNSLVFEPGFTLRGGSGDLKAQLQYSYSTFRYHEPTGQPFGYSDNYVSLGLFWMISERYK